MPHVKPWLTLAEWGKKYGDISHIEVLGQHIIVLNSTKTAMEILDKKSSIYSDRPVFPMAELVGLKDVLTMLPYGDSLRSNRRNFQRLIGSRAAMKDFHPIETIETHRFLKRVLAEPGELMEHLQHTAGAVILRISHGYEVQEKNDPFVDLANRANAIFSKSTAPGAWMVDIIPSLAEVPEWFPGAGFKRVAREWNRIFEEMVSAPFQFVKDQMAAGIAPKSFTSSLLEGTLSAEEEHMLKWTAGTLYGAGSDTVCPSLHVRNYHNSVDTYFLRLFLQPMRFSWL
ncbi:hypothetical protein AZE42_09070 [Rhizopogon vesiculosus]|uniref:Cytochrome P450 n=1 Tax=Rhizopogon vesiculosus TaxID=180088 RepID=A0A1J8QW87_9AGAM|nr:hypothetical protein AZE42_09070 [Rhizopogon vesiculosus]